MYSLSMTGRADDVTLRVVAEELRAAIGAFARATRARADSLPRSRAETLGDLSRRGPQSMAVLAAARGVTHQTVSRMVAEMEQLDLVLREPNPVDARGFLIAISEQGERALTVEREARSSTIADAIAASLTPAQRRTLAQVPGLLNRLTDALAPTTAD
ncbi:MarR family winged helix-turn-helix transcriptional regulator [Micromonosporaceae bacterium Da 78-11]